MPETKTEINLSTDAKLVSWTLLSGESGIPLLASDFPDKCVVVRGTFGAILTIQGANVEGMPPAAAWQTLNDPQGNALTFTAARV